MIYLDYSANTPADSRVLERFCEVERSCPGNANSRHQAGRDAKLVIDHATQTIAGLLSAQPAEVIYTSGASEANNFALKGLAKLSRHLGKHIISTPLEHSSVSGTLTALQEQGYEIDLVDIRRDGTIDLEHLKELLRPDTIAVAVTLVDSELGVVQPVKEISARFLQDSRSWILMPTKVEYYISDDNVNFTYFGTVSYKLDPKEENNTILNFKSTNFANKKARYVKVIAKNFGKLPEWHQGAGGDAFIFVDEITIK